MYSELFWESTVGFGLSRLLAGLVVHYIWAELWIVIWNGLFYAYYVRVSLWLAAGVFSVFLGLLPLAFSFCSDNGFARDTLQAVRNLTFINEVGDVSSSWELDY